MNKFLLSVLAGVSLLSSSAFAMDAVPEDRKGPAIGRLRQDLFTQELSKYVQNDRQMYLFMRSNRELGTSFGLTRSSTIITAEEWAAYPADKKKSFNLETAEMTKIALGVQDLKNPGQYFDALTYMLTIPNSKNLCWLDVNCTRFGKGPLPKITALQGKKNRGDLTEFNMQSMKGKTMSSVFLSRINAPEVNCSNLVFKGGKITESNLRNANMKGITLAKFDLTNTDLSGADMTGADITETILTHVKMKGTILSGVTLKGDQFWQAFKGGADLTGSIIQDAACENRNFNHANLQGLTFNNVSFEGSSFEYADLSGINAAQCNFNNTHMSYAKLVKAELRTGSRYYAANKFNDAEMIGVDMTGVNLGGTKLLHANLSGATLCDGVFNHTDFSGGNLSNANLSGDRFCGGASFEQTIIRGAQFQGLRELNVRGSIGREEAIGLLPHHLSQ